MSEPEKPFRGGSADPQGHDEGVRVTDRRRIDPETYEVRGPPQPPPPTNPNSPPPNPRTGSNTLSQGRHKQSTGYVNPINQNGQNRSLRRTLSPCLQRNGMKWSAKVSSDWHLGMPKEVRLE